MTKVEEGYQPLNDSSMIISLVASHLHDKSYKIEDLSNYYPSIGMQDEEGNFKFEIINKYFLMFNKQIPKNRTMNDIKYVNSIYIYIINRYNLLNMHIIIYFLIFSEERKWRRWVDDVFVHVLSPNVYRTIDESYRTFRWFSHVSVNSFSFLNETNRIKIYFI